MIARSTSALAAALILGLALVGSAANPQAQTLRQQLKIQESLLQTELEQLERHAGSLQEAWVRVDRELADYLRAQVQEESTASLRLRDVDLRQAESEAMMQLLESQRLRRAAITIQGLIEKTREEIGLLEGEAGPSRDPITGTWDIVVEPGGQNGQLILELDGTLIQGTYTLDGGWHGSLRGTLVGGKVRLERIDAQIGFAAIYYGALDFSTSEPRLVGRWEATQLASGLPAAGAWLAERAEVE